MYYNRTISHELSSLIEEMGDLRWLYQFVRENKELDFLIGRNDSKEWVSVYRGLTRLLTFSIRNNKLKIEADKKYLKLIPGLYGLKDFDVKFIKEINELIGHIKNDDKLKRYYDNKKEGFFQNELSRLYGICGKKDSDFVIIDKEAVIGYTDTTEKNKVFGQIQGKYKSLQKEISLFDSKEYGKNLEKKAIGNELDFLALDREGNILLIEYKHGTNTSGIYLSPLQIGLYYDLFTKFPKEELKKAVFQMLEQKQKIGLINKDWIKPKEIKDIIPVLIISEYNYKSTAKDKFSKILQFSRKHHGDGFLNNIQSYNYTSKEGLSTW